MSQEYFIASLLVGSTAKKKTIEVTNKQSATKQKQNKHKIRFCDVFYRSGFAFCSDFSYKNEMKLDINGSGQLQPKTYNQFLNVTPSKAKGHLKVNLSRNVLWVPNLVGIQKAISC